MDRLLQLLGLGEDATLEQISAAITDENVASVAAVLGLPAEASREEVLAAIGGLLGVGGGEAAATGEEVAEVYSRAYGRHFARSTAKRLGLDGAIDSPEQLITVASQRLKNPPGFVHKTEANQLREEKKALEQRLVVLERKDQRREFEALISSDEHKGKITPAVAEEYFEIFCSGRARFDKILGAMAKVANLSGDSELEGRLAGGGDGQDGPHPFEQAIETIIAERKVRRIEAQRIARRENPRLFEQYRRNRRVGKAED